MFCVHVGLPEMPGGRQDPRTSRMGPKTRLLMGHASLSHRCVGDKGVGSIFVTLDTSSALMLNMLVENERVTGRDKVTWAS